MMYLFVLGACLTFGFLSWSDWKRFLPFWGPAVLAWSFSIGREPSVWFLGLFLVPTIILGVAVAMKRLSPIPFLLLAISDIALALGLSIFQSKSALWTLPGIGGWGSGAGLAAAAAILRLGVAADAENPREGGLLSIPWWQGAMLAYWAGGEGAIVLVIGGVLLWGTAAYASHSNLAALTLAGGVLAVAAGLGADLAGVIALGVAGTALAMGERVVSTWMVAILPLSLLTVITLPAGDLMALPALVFPGAWAAMSTRVVTIKPTEQDAVNLAPAAGLAVIAYLAALVSSFYTGAGELGELGIPVEAINAIWILYGAGIAAGVTTALTAATTDPKWETQPPRDRHAKSDILLPKLLPPVAWFTFFVAAVIAVRLLLAGFRTSFL